MSRIVTGYIEPITAKKLMASMNTIAGHQRMKHAPVSGLPDFDHPLVKALTARMPHLSYSELEAVQAHLMTHDARAVTNARAVDGMLRLVNAELLRRDHERYEADVSFIDWLSSKGIVK